MRRERLVRLEGNLNLRDLGGYTGRDGRTVRWGRLYRSDALHALTSGDLDVLRSLGLRAVYDFRHDAECERQPTVRWSDEVRIVRLCIGDAVESGPALLDQILDGSLPEADDQLVVDRYVEVLRDAAPVFGALLTSLAVGDDLPALFHCTAGKDRTGLAAALVLSALGVDRETILDDDCLTNGYRSNRRIEELRPMIEAAGVDLERVRPFLSARRPVLSGALAWLEAEHAGAEPYLTGVAQVAPVTLDALRDELLQ